MRIPGIERYLVHATRSGSGSLRVATRVAPLSEAASWANRVRKQDTYSTLIKDSVDLAIYWMGGDPGGPGLDNELADSAVDIIAKPLEWVADTVLKRAGGLLCRALFHRGGRHGRTGSSLLARTVTGLKHHNSRLSHRHRFRSSGVKMLAPRTVHPLVGMRAEVIALRLQQIRRQMAER